MSSKKYFWLSVIFLIVIPLVFAVPPVSQVTSFGEGYIIKYPSNQFLKQNMPYEFEAHVFNITNGYPIISGISCYFHLYNSTGKHQLELADTTSSHNFDYSFDVAGGNFSVVGDYYYIIQCNNSNKGGFVEVPFEVTPNGLETTEGRAVVDIGLLFVLIIFMGISIAIMVKGNHLLTKVGMFGLSYLLLMAITFVAWNMATDFLLSAPFISDMFRILFYVLIAGVFPLIIGGFAWYVIMMFRIKEIERMMSKGIGEDEAQRRQGRKYR